MICPVRPKQEEWFCWSCGLGGCIESASYDTATHVIYKMKSDHDQRVRELQVTCPKAVIEKLSTGKSRKLRDKILEDAVWRKKFLPFSSLNQPPSSRSGRILSGLAFIAVLSTGLLLTKAAVSFAGWLSNLGSR